MRTIDLDYHLPPERIATQPADPRDSARLFVAHRDSGNVEHRTVRDLPDLGVLQPGDLLVLNHSRVIPALFEARRTTTGGHIQGLYLSGDDNGHWRIMLRSRGKVKPGETIEFDQRARINLLKSLGGGQWEAQLHADEPTMSLLDRLGRAPLPPYIRKARKAHHQPEVRAEDAERYNTVYACAPGSIAAPTAGMHFTDDLLARLGSTGVRRAEVTLHIGIGTFAPVRSATLEQHKMHEEWIGVPPEVVSAIHETRASNRRVIPVGTTTVRALESLPDDADHFTGTTGLFIHPDAGFTFRFTDMLLTNFHLPKSTLLAMVASLPGVGVDRLLGWYRAAIDGGYRFYSYGDAMLIV